MKTLLLTFILSSLAFTATKKAVIATNACCGASQIIIERALLEVEGVKSADLDLVTFDVNVKYDPKLTDVAVLRQAIAGSGFQADDVLPRPKAVAILPACCRSGKQACGKKEEVSCDN